ncbi:MAG: DNA polymerase IV [Chloroflexi bacterium]|nr:DNA polymerase IV [Chloroflexota bacterium]
MSSTARCILHVDMDAFFVSVEQARHPQLRGKAVVVGGEPGGRGVVAAASYPARAYGLRAGMSLTVAQRLCPHAIFLPGNFAHYRETSERFMAMLAHLTPEVEVGGIDEAYLDLTGFDALYGPPRETARNLKERIRKELGLTASVGIATSKVVAKVASDLEKPDGLVEVPLGEEASFLAPLPIGRLPGVGPEVEKRLRGVGISTIGQLATTPAIHLRALLGVWGEVLHRYARGVDTRKLAPPPPAKSISRSTTFPQDTWDRDFLGATLRYLSERVAAELRREAKWARCVTLKLRYADFQTISRSRTLKGPSDSEEVIFAVGQELMEGALRQRRCRVRLVGIEVARLVGGGWQLSLWDRSQDRWKRLHQAMDGVRHKYGFTALQVGRTVRLANSFPQVEGDYLLKTSCLSR